METFVPPVKMRVWMTWPELLNSSRLAKSKACSILLDGGDQTHSKVVALATSEWGFFSLTA